MRLRFSVRSAAVMTVGVGLLVSCSSESTQGASTQTAPPASTTTAAETTVPQPLPPVDECVTFVDGLTERQRLAQLLTVGVTGTADAVQIMSTEQVGGLFVGSWTDESMLGNREVPQVLDASAVAPMITIDEEGGRVSRVADLLGEAPSARVLAQTVSVDEAYQAALTRGQGLK
ncbi:glycoside hydrolase family 3 N-terminal domain-containing protein, partial [Rhodococcus sp. EPR-147]|uniref:glycoside hydrolase family 3 N-terminal domain-containing protein n=1 Tax=Rhodococcus sp. EPR-147 TaxID=1813676 RepID=UPI002F911D0C